MRNVAGVKLLEEADIDGSRKQVLFEHNTWRRFYQYCKQVEK